MLNAGVPFDGMNASLVYRPWWWLRLHAGGGYNFVSPGVQGGLALVPFRTWFTPTLVLEGGHYFDGNANETIRTFGGSPDMSSPLLERIGYDYGNARLGFEFGRRWATFYIHAGYTYMTTTLHGANQALGSSEVTIRKDPEATALTVSARIGLIVYVY